MQRKRHTRNASSPPRAGLCAASGPHSGGGGELLPGGASPGSHTSLCPRKNFLCAESACVDYISSTPPATAPHQLHSEGFFPPSSPGPGFVLGHKCKTSLRLRHGHSCVGKYFSQMPKQTPQIEKSMEDSKL